MIYCADTFSLILPDALALHGMDANEQGGILLGKGHTVQRFTVPGPLDFCTPGMFLLLDPCHEEALNTSGLSYLGFWHSHPPGTPSEFSPEDLHGWESVAEHLFPQLPAAHLFFPIVTGDRLRVWSLSRDLHLTELSKEV